MTAFDGEHIIFAESSNIQIANRQFDTTSDPVMPLAGGLVGRSGGSESAVTFSIPATHRREITCLDFDQGNLLMGFDKKPVRREEIEPNERVFTYQCSFFSSTLFIWKQNGSELHFSNI